MWSILLSIALAAVGFFMMFIILLQRGRGGGLAGAFGGLGGQSAFGTKAGDVFTKITIVVSVVWVLLAGLLGIIMWSESEEGKYKGGSNVLEEVSTPDNGDDAELPPRDGGDGAAGGGLDGSTGLKNAPAEPDDEKSSTDPPAKDAPNDNESPN
jgi:preprotein translocase subunit SecG